MRAQGLLHEVIGVGMVAECLLHMAVISRGRVVWRVRVVLGGRWGWLVRSWIRLVT
jgi:hypothetical protein